jgi:hypothetical protein
MAKYLRLNLDELYSSAYYYTDYDIGSEGHAIIIRAEDKEDFLDQFTRIWRERAEDLLEEDEEFEEDETE